VKTRPELSLVMNTARASNSIPGEPDRHLFDVLAESLEAQTGEIPPFELVIADTEWATRPDYWTNRRAPFPVKHIEARGWWTERGCCAISAHKNASVIHAEAPWIFTLDDGTRFPPDFVARLWRWMRGYNLFPCAWYQWEENPATKDARDHAVPPDGKRFAVSNMTQADWAGQKWPIHGYGYVGFTADAFYAVNGYDLAFDGGRGQEDIEFSLRLMRAGHRLVLDRDLTAIQLRQGPVAVYTNPDVPTGVVHCTSGLAPLLYKEIAAGTRHRANAEPFPRRLLGRLWPSCCWYVPDDRHDADVFECPDCEETTSVRPADVPEVGLACPVDFSAMRLDPDRAVRLAGRCSLYHDPCPFAPIRADGAPASYTANHAHHPLYHEAFIADPGRFEVDLRGEHDRAIAGGHPDRATFVGVDWK